MENISLLKKLSRKWGAIVCFMIVMLCGKVSVAQNGFSFFYTDPLAAGNIHRGATDQLIYIDRVETTFGKSSAIWMEATTIGQYQVGDVSRIKFWWNTTNSLVGATNIQTFDVINYGPRPFAVRFKEFIFPEALIYFLITVDISSDAKIGSTISVGKMNYLPGDYGYLISRQDYNSGIQTIAAPLPVTLVSFKAKAEGNVRHLSWETSMEKDNDYFEIQRSTDAKNFTAIGKVKGAAGGGENRRYSYTDSENVPEGVLYYRLKMVDLDGSFAYSSIQSVQLEKTLDVAILPNPVAESFTVKGVNWQDVRELRLYNMTGQEVYQSVMDGQDKSIDVKSLGAGMYVAELLFKNGQKKTSKIAIAR